VIFESMEQAATRVAGKGAVLRPWLQYFDDYPWATGRQYNAAEIQAQKKAAADAGSVGWMMWDPFNRYARGGLDPR
jgi:Putative glycosyl hydrolase domain